MTMRVTLRCEGTPSDRRAIERITRSTGFFTEDEVEIALDVFDDALLERDSGYECVLAETDKGVCGYAIWGRDDQTINSYELYWIAVSNRGRGRGVGSMLLEAIEQRIATRGGGQLFIETSGKAQYQPTRAFYERRGYSIVARLEDYFAPGDARVIYAKRLAAD